MTTHAVQSETNSFRPREHRLVLVSDGGRRRSPPKSSLIAVSRPAFDDRFVCVLFIYIHYYVYLTTLNHKPDPERYTLLAGRLHRPLYC
jgi:hypothetical protein